MSQPQLAQLKAPFPWFGGKRRIAALVWDRLGDVRNAIEPFCGSAAWILARPHPPQIETVNDIDCYVANFWRATQADPDAVAEHADWPVNEADLHARHRWLVMSETAAEFRERVRTDPHFHDPKIAGWWAWGQCCWIGGGWCTWSNGPIRRPDLANDGKGAGLVRGPKQQAPETAGVSHGKGVHRKLDQSRPGISDGEGRGVHAKRPALGDGNGGAGGKGVHRSGGRPQLADEYSRGRGVHGNDAMSTCEQRRRWLLDWFGRLRDRLRSVRVCCGDWKRVCGSRSVTTRIGVTGVFLDPPYSADVGRDTQLYACESGDVAHEVREWCAEHGENRQMRIALCGYEGEHESLEGQGWEVVAWQAQGGYGNRGAPNTNKARERVWFSPACLAKTDRQRSLFAGIEHGG